MKYFNIIIFFSISIVIASCSAKETSSESTQTETVLQPTDQIEFIREKYALIESNMASNTYSVIQLVKQTDFGSITYKRAMDGDKVMFAYSSDCNDHGCSQSSYYFWNNELLFKFNQNSSWVGQSDKVSEKRTYYLNEKEFLCLEKTKTGAGGYDAVKKQLSKVPSDTLPCSSVFDRSTIKEHLEFTNDEVKELALVKKVDNGLYPMYYMTFYFADREETETLYVDSERIMFHDPLSQLAGKTVRVGYLYMKKTKMQGLYGATDVVGEINPEWKMSKGIVQNIEGVTTGDLPDQVTIEAEDGSNIVFDYFIDSDMMSYSNKPVTIYYTTKERKEVTSLELMEEEVVSDSESGTGRGTTEVQRNWIYAENDKFIIKVDRLVDNTMRYTSWNKPKEITDSPDLILSNGEVVQQGTAGGYDYIFENNDWQYILKDVWMSEAPDGEGIFLYLTQNGEEKLYTKLIDLKMKDLDEQQASQETVKAEGHYICYTEDNNPELYIWIRFSGGKAKEIKYKGMNSSLELEFVKESENLNPGGPYPVFADYYNEIVDGKINGVYKLTHSGNYDYAEYIRAKDSKIFNFTIDHAANPYGNTPCF